MGLTPSNLLLIIITMATQNIRATYGLIGFVCGDQNNERIAYDLQSFESCRQAPQGVQDTPIHIQIVRPQGDFVSEALTCRVERRQSVVGCGMHGHMYQIEGGITWHAEILTQDQCDKLIKAGVFVTPYSKPIINLKPNAVHRPTIIEIGDIKGETCYGDSYYDVRHNKQISSVIVSSEYEIFFSRAEARYNSVYGAWVIDGTKIAINEEGYSMSAQLGNVYIMNPTISECSSNNLIVLYEGPANENSRNVSTTQGVVRAQKEISVISEDQVFMITRSSRTSKCGFMMWSTEYDNMYIIDASVGSYPIQTSTDKSRGFSLSTYVDTKVSMLRKETMENVQSLYKELSARQCESRQQISKNLASIARVDPGEFAYRIMGDTPGYAGVVNGDIAYVLKCRPTPLKQLWNGTKCYKEIPVEYNMTMWFVNTHTRLLQRYGSEIPCDPRFPAGVSETGTMSYFGATSIAHTDLLAVEAVKTQQEVEFIWTSYNDVSRFGMFSSDDADSFISQALLPQESKSISADLVYKYTGSDYGSSSKIGLNFFPKDFEEKLVQSISGQVYSYVREIGIIFSFIGGLMFIFQIISGAINTVATGKLIHEDYGWSWTMLCVSCPGLVNWVLRKKSDPEERELDEDQKVFIEIEPPRAQ